MKMTPMTVPNASRSGLLPAIRSKVPQAGGLLLCAGLITGCASPALTTPDVTASVRAELPAAPASAPKAAPAAVPARVSDALAEPAAPAAEPRIDLLVNNAQAREVFLAIVADTRYSMLMHPDVQGTLSVTLRGVTVTEALESIRDVYGYDFRIEGRRITVYAPTLQTRIFTLNYPNSQRVGNSDLRVSAGGVSGASSSAPNTGAPATQAANSGSTSTQSDSSRVSTSSRSDIWGEVADSVRALIGTGQGRNVVASPQAGILAVRAMPDELRQVEKFLKATQISVERQVMLEAKIVQVELRDGYQSGIDWSGFRNQGNTTMGLGTIGGSNANNVLISGVKNNLPGLAPATAVAALADNVAVPAAAGGVFGLALATEGFQAVLGFLETRGDVQILSSPRIATLNNQKALLKVGTDEFFITSITGGSTATGSNTTNNNSNTNSLPTVTLAPFFSGIALDVTPQIDAANNITLHVRPSVTTVSEKTKQVDLGIVGNYRLPLAASAVNESDTVVRIPDGKIVAIGGLMQVESNNSASGMPGTTGGPLSWLLGNKAATGRKKELVVLIKPTIIRTAADWEAQTQRARATLDEMDDARTRVIRMDGSAAK